MKTIFKSIAVFAIFTAAVVFLVSCGKNEPAKTSEPSSEQKTSTDAVSPEKPAESDKAEPDKAKPDKTESDKDALPKSDAESKSLKTVSETVSKGEPAPEFALEDFNGKTVKLSDYKGKIVVLEWLNYDCPFVKAQYDSGNLPAIAKKYADKGVVWLAINSSHYATHEANKEFAQKHNITYPILLDADGAVGRKYQARTTPHVFVIDAAGRIAYQGAVDNAPMGKVPAEGKIEYLANALDALLAGKPIETPQTKPYGCSVKYKK